MGLGDLFRRKTRTVALIDVGSASVGGAYATFAENDNPIIWYTAREEITVRENRLLLSDLERALSALLARMATEGAVALARNAGSGVIDDILVSVAAPWEETRVAMRTVERKSAFTFTRALINEAFSKEEVLLGQGRVLVDHAVVATLLNGYETNEPFGKRATRADLVVLTTTLDEQAAVLIKDILARTYHRHVIGVAGFPFIAYTVFRDVYPHERDYLIVDVTGAATDVSIVKRGILMDVTGCDCGLHDMLAAAIRRGRTAPGSLPELSALRSPHELYGRAAAQLDAAKEAWREEFHRALSGFAARFPLPRTVFLLADDSVREFLRELIVGTPLPELRLSDTPFEVISVTPDQLAPYVHTRGDASGDEFLAMLALFANRGMPHADA